MSVQKVLPAAVLEQAHESVGLPQVNTEFRGATEKGQVNKHERSIGSSLLFGLGTLVFVSPMVIPGIPINWLAVGYLGLFGVAVMAIVFWAGIRAFNSRMQRSRHRRVRS